MTQISKDTFIQWKGTDVCIDIHFPCCGTFIHVDGYFMYAIKCPACGIYYKVSDSIMIVQLKSTDTNYDGLKKNADEPGYTIQVIMEDDDSDTPKL